jgi:hypothetical protein
MSCNNPYIFQKGQLVTLVAAVSTLSPFEKHGQTPHSSAAESESIHLEDLNENATSKMFLSRTAKVKVVSMTQMVLPSDMSSNAIDSHQLINVSQIHQC